MTGAALGGLRGATALRLIESAPAALLIIDSELSIVHANCAAAELFGVARAEIEATPALRHLPGLELDLPDAPSRAPAELVFAGIAGKSVAVAARRGRQTATIELEARRLDLDGESLWIIALRDVSELESEYRRLQRTAHELEDFYRMAVGRELRMIALKKEVNALAAQAARSAPYPDVENEG
jgi:PAS domain S-box-containing protein